MSSSSSSMRHLTSSGSLPLNLFKYPSASRAPISLFISQRAGRVFAKDTLLSETGLSLGMSRVADSAFYSGRAGRDSLSAGLIGLVNRTEWSSENWYDSQGH